VLGRAVRVGLAPQCDRRRSPCRVQHLVRSSIFGADPASPARFVRRHGQADQHLRESTVPHTILRPNFYVPVNDDTSRSAMLAAAHG